MATVQEAVAEFGAFHVLVGVDVREVIKAAKDSLPLVVSHFHPDHGLHPVKVGPQIARLRAAAMADEGVTHLVYTCSPLVLNECDPAEASIVTRNAAGEVVVTRFDRTKDFARRSGAFALGELWLTFCDGGEESQLVGGE